jgi:hypothetical protein
VLPVITRGGGILDGVIDDWHRTLGVPHGERALVPSNSYRVGYQRGSAPPVIVSSGTALGDTALEAGRVLFAGAQRELTVWLGAELPSGSRAHATGNGAVDLAAWLAGRTVLGRVVDLAAQVGMSRFGSTAPVNSVHRTAEFGTLALGWHVSHAITALVQVDAHSAIVKDSALPLLQQAITLAFGGRFRLGAATALDVGVMEDIEVDHSPDVVFYFALRRKFAAP